MELSVEGAIPICLCYKSNSNQNGCEIKFIKRLRSDRMDKIVRSCFEKKVTKVVQKTCILTTCSFRCNNLDKMRTRLMHELEDSGVELERTRSELNAMDKKCKKIDQIVLEWKGKYDTASSQVETLTLELQKSNVST